MPKEQSARPALAYPLTVSFTVAMATLVLQLVQTRIYGVVFWNHVVYFIISIALLGFGISGTWLAFGPESRVAKLLSLRNAGIAFVATALFSSLVAPQFVISLGAVGESLPRTAQLMAVYATALLPYFFGGWMLGTVFRDYAERIHVLYFADLVGAGLGCLGFLALIQPIGAIHVVLLTCLIAGLPPLIHTRKDRVSQAVLAAGALVFGLCAFFEPTINRSIQPESTKAFMRLYDELDSPTQKHWEFSEWNAISRIDVVSADVEPQERPRPVDFTTVFIDGDAFTPIVKPFKYLDPDVSREGLVFKGNLAPYFFTASKFDAALVIGTGGGYDVVHALAFGAQSVDAVEINPTTFRLLHEEYVEQSYELMAMPGVRAFNEEGRSFVARTDRKYDVITMTGIDTFAAINSGAYVLSENYLYTIEAMLDYLGHLTDDGMLNITRWLHYAETPRLFIVAYEALLQLGIEDPSKHIILQGVDLATLTVRMTPFTEQEILEFGNHIRAGDAKMHYPAHPEHTIQPDIAAYVDARKSGTADPFFKQLDYDIKPVDDDSPFFFHFDKPRTLYRAFSGDDPEDLIRGHWPSFTLFILLGFTLVTVTLFMFIPLLHRGHPRIPGFGAWLVYFTCLGISFIFVEIALMQRFALLLGHPSRSLAIVLSSLLIFAGVGSMARGTLNINLKTALGALVVTLLLVAFVYPIIVEAVLGWSLFARAAITIALVAPPAFVMGMPFPTGLQAVSRHGGEAVPWMWGVNGGTTVLGSILAIVIAIWGSFTLVLLVAALGYLLALVLYAKLAPASS